MSILSTLVGPVTGLLDKVLEDKDQKARLAHEIATIADKQSHEVALQQIELNKIEQPKVFHKDGSELYHQHFEENIP